MRDIAPPPRPAWYVGAPGSGKTTAAVAHALGDARARAVPLVVVDTIACANVGKLPLVEPGSELVRAVWHDRQHVRVAPETARDLAAVLAAVRGGGMVSLVVDEAGIWFGQGGTRPILALLRGYRHAGVGIRLTTQHLSGDVPQTALALAPDLYVFQTSSPRGLEVIERNWGISRDKVRGLPPRQYVRVSTAAAVDPEPPKRQPRAGPDPKKAPNEGRKKNPRADRRGGAR